MALADFRAFLRAHRRIALDTNVFIYEMDTNSRYASLAAGVFEWIYAPAHSAVTSVVTMTELLVQPYRLFSQAQVDRLFNKLTGSKIEWIPPSLEIADIAARVRAKHRLQVADALQAATAIHTGATAMITNDGAFERVTAFDAAVLDRFL